MKKDFTQPFITEATNIHLLAQDSTTENFLLLRSYDDDEENGGAYAEENYYTPLLSLRGDKDMHLEIVKILRSYNLSVSGFRELARLTRMDYSFIDNTPGSLQEDLCLHVWANTMHSEDKNPDAVMLPLSYFTAKLSEALQNHHSALGLGITRLLTERGLIIAKSSKLWGQLLQYGADAPRELVVAYIKAVAEEAKMLPSSEREIRGGTSPHSLSKGEEIASKIIVGLARQDWLDGESDPELDEILGIAGQLDINPASQQLWKELFDKIEKLQ